MCKKMLISGVKMMNDSLASQVAAGEVVENPASVAKELIENSLDAGATSIDIIAERSGMNLLRIKDNGCGMSKSDALMALERHATSKLYTSEDLSKISTYGFRGEALPSIASVSRLSLKTRLADDLHGTCIKVHGGKLIDVKDVGCPPGTEVEVADIFFNVPARKKFLRSRQIELAKLEEIVRVIALARPEIAFSFTHGKREFFRVPRGDKMLERLRVFLGSELAMNLLKVETCETRFQLEGKSQRMILSGFIGKPAFPWRNAFASTTQLAFINGRPLRLPQINKILRENFTSLFPAKSRPYFYLCFEIPPHAYDINVHPAKREARIRSPKALEELIFTALESTFERHRKKYRERLFTQFAKDSREKNEQTEKLTQISTTEIDQEDFANKKNKVEIPAPQKKTEDTESKMLADDEYEFADNFAEMQEELPITNVSVKNTNVAKPDKDENLTAQDFTKYLGNLHLKNTFFHVYGNAEGMVLLRISAARARIIYEKIRQKNDKIAPSQKLLQAEIVDLNPQTFALAMSMRDDLAQMGLEIDAFGRNAIKIEAVPSFSKRLSPRENFNQIFVEALNETVKQKRAASSKTNKRGFLLDRYAAAIASRSTHFFQQPDRENPDELMRDLRACQMPYCDPNGKATMIQISETELRKRFGD